ncbi:hypothetical protein RJ55_04014 [Drechmeria coniospora]|nr:hypothetical protein RJ55_04014 [Drechmeria coniospora]
MDKLFNAGKEFLESQNQRQDQRGDNDEEFRNAHDEASRLAGSSGNSAMFSQIMGAIGQKKGQIANEDLDEEDAISKYKHAYQNDGRGDETTLGVAAAMQALKKFNQGEGSGSSGASQSLGSFVAIAMSEASKLFDSKAADGKIADGASKESTVQKAGEMAMKMYFKSQGQQQGGLMGLASKFM